MMALPLPDRPNERTKRAEHDDDNRSIFLSPEDVVASCAAVINASYSDKTQETQDTDEEYEQPSSLALLVVNNNHDYNKNKTTTHSHKNIPVISVDNEDSDTDKDKKRNTPKEKNIEEEPTHSEQPPSLALVAQNNDHDHMHKSNISSVDNFDTDEDNKVNDGTTTTPDDDETTDEEETITTKTDTAVFTDAVNVNVIVVVETVNILKQLQNLGTSTHLEQALEAMTVLADHIIKGNNAQQVVDASGLATIVFAMYRYYETSERIVLYGLGILVDMTYRLGEGKRYGTGTTNSTTHSNYSNVVGHILQRLSFLNQIPHLVTGGGSAAVASTISSAATTTTTTSLTTDPIVLLSNRQIQSKAACLLNNLALYAATDSDPIMMDCLASEELVVFMRNVILSYPDEVLLNEAVCQYLELVTSPSSSMDKTANVVVIIIKDRLLKLGVVPPLTMVFHKFSNYYGGGANTAMNIEDENDDGTKNKKKNHHSVKECVERIVENSKLVLDRLVVC
jgi:hypothetical protein